MFFWIHCHLICSILFRNYPYTLGRMLHVNPRTTHCNKASKAWTPPRVTFLKKPKISEKFGATTRRHKNHRHHVRHHVLVHMFTLDSSATYPRVKTCRFIFFLGRNGMTFRHKSDVLKWNTTIMIQQSEYSLDKSCEIMTPQRNPSVVCMPNFWHNTSPHGMEKILGFFMEDFDHRPTRRLCWNLTIRNWSLRMN